ncbi:MAG: hypothetical protein A2X36_17520 [Elusimicrobia bacterium GWA2_69_24]|nr:MAG: hypothetical protein A2X36_17520 [Elusimicrobia bacterium GWA2_69_24]HBL18776.1 hypothetical protein [Elusimicrobiota bacterium]
MDLSYRFRFDDGREKSFELKLDPKTLTLQSPERGSSPDWVRLGNHRCTNCPLSAAEFPDCPVAKNLVEVIEQFKDSISFHEVDISIRTKNREYRKRAPVQNGVSGLIGVVMVTSGCPNLDKLRPMVCTHLPFADVHETMYRALSMYLLAQYFRHKKGKEPDWELKRLVEIYDAIGIVNRCFTDRLRTARIEDASLNALVSLDCFATMTVALLMDQSLPQLETLFHAYLKD